MKYDKIIILSAERQDNNKRFPNFKNGMYSGGQVRMDAAALIAKSNPSSEIIVVGGYNELGTGDLDSSEKVDEISEFLRARVPNIRLQLIYSLPCTHHNFVAVFNRWKKENLFPNNVAVLTNSYHLPRAMEFAKRCNDELLKDNMINFHPLSAEDTIGESMEQIIGKRTSEYRSRIDKERDGLKKIISGQYKDYCLTRDFEKLKLTINKRYKELLTQNEAKLLGLIN